MIFFTVTTDFNFFVILRVLMSSYFNFCFIFFQIFVLSDSEQLSLEIGVDPEFAKEKLHELNRFET